MPSKIRFTWITLFFLVLCPLLSANEIEGRWSTNDGEATIELKITNGTLSGYLLDWKNKKWTTDSFNPNSKLRKRPLKGLCVLYGLMKENTKWDGGRIYDASEGETYRASAWLENKDTLVIRGYIGVSLIGKTTKWQRHRNQ